MAAAQARRNVLMILACAQFIIILYTFFTTTPSGVFMNNLHTETSGAHVAITFYLTVTATFIFAGIRFYDFKRSAGLTVLSISPHTAPQAVSALTAASRKKEEGGLPLHALT